MLLLVSERRLSTTDCAHVYFVAIIRFVVNQLKFYIVFLEISNLPSTSLGRQWSVAVRLKAENLGCIRVTWLYVIRERCPRTHNEYKLFRKYPCLLYRCQNFQLPLLYSFQFTPTIYFVSNMCFFSEIVMKTIPRPWCCSCYIKCRTPVFHYIVCSSK